MRTRTYFYAFRNASSTSSSFIYSGTLEKVTLAFHAVCIRKIIMDGKVIKRYVYVYNYAYNRKIFAQYTEVIL